MYEDMVSGPEIPKPPAYTVVEPQISQGSEYLATIIYLSTTLLK